MSSESMGAGRSALDGATTPDDAARTTPGRTMPGRTPRAGRWRHGLVAALVLACGLLHVLTDPHAHHLHDFYFKLTYIQIILAALWFGRRGGLCVSLVTSLIYIGHIELQLAGHGPHSRVTLFFEIALYNVVAVLVGTLSDRQRAARRRLEDARDALERSYVKLREQATALLAAEDALRESHRLKITGQLAAEFAHEVRNPLGGIVGATEILTRPGVDDARRREFADLLTRETHRLDRVVAEFLDIARRPAVTPATSRLAAVSDAVRSLLRRQLAEASVTLDLEDDTGGVLLAISSEHLHQVLLNLVLNAIDAVAPGGCIRIRGERHGAVVRVRVTDDGPGVPEMLRPRLFEPFISGRSGGSGLGLAIVRRLLEEAGGTIELATTGRDTADAGATAGATRSAGAVFLIEIPTHEPHASGGEIAERATS